MGSQTPGVEGRRCRGRGPPSWEGGATGRKVAQGTLSAAARMAQAPGSRLSDPSPERDSKEGLGRGLQRGRDRSGSLVWRRRVCAWSDAHGPRLGLWALLRVVTGGLQVGSRARLLPRRSQGQPGVPSAATLGHQDPPLQEGPGGTGGDRTRPQLRGGVALGTCWKLSPRASIPGLCRVSLRPGAWGPRSPRGGGHPAVMPASGDPGEGWASLRFPCPSQRCWAGTG